MHNRAPVIAVVGRKKSGKTTVIEGIVQELTKAGYRVATVKHVTERGFSMDTEGKDTWRHSRAGANPVVSVSDAETAVLIKDGEAKFSLDQLFRFTPEIDTILLEGFSQLVLGDEKVGKILCVKDRKEYRDFREKTMGEIIASCSTRPVGKPILRIREDSQILARKALEFVKTERKPSKIRSRLKTKITINDVEVPLQPFVSEIIRSVLLSMVSTLKDVSISGNEDVHIKILSQR
jgi:molybdopterin-guanine dinucleotide biosynthesis protein B